MRLHHPLHDAAFGRTHRYALPGMGRATLCARPECPAWCPAPRNLPPATRRACSSALPHSFSRPVEVARPRAAGRASPLGKTLRPGGQRLVVAQRRPRAALDVRSAVPESSIVARGCPGMWAGVSAAACRQPPSSVGDRGHAIGIERLSAAHRRPPDAGACRPQERRAHRWRRPCSGRRPCARRRPPVPARQHPPSGRSRLWRSPRRPSRP